MKKGTIEQINTALVSKYGDACQLEIGDCGVFGPQIIWRGMALDFAGLDEIDAIMDELRTLRHELYYAQIKEEHEEKRG